MKKNNTELKFCLIFTFFLIFCSNSYSNEKKTKKTNPNPNVLVSPADWADFTKNEKTTYIKSVLETMTFLLYSSYSKSDEKSQQDFSDMQICLKSISIKTEYASDWLFGENLDKSQANEIWNSQAKIWCEKYKGKGDKSWKPYELVAESEYKKYSDREYSIYAKAYIETVLVFLEKLKNEKEAKVIHECLKKEDFNTFVKNIKSTPPDKPGTFAWTVSIGFGKFCKSYR